MPLDTPLTDIPIIACKLQQAMHHKVYGSRDGGGEVGVSTRPLYGLLNDPHLLSVFRPRNSSNCFWKAFGLLRC